MTARGYNELCTDELGAKALELAAARLGVRETAPNWGPDVGLFLASVGIARPAPWCAAFLSRQVRDAELMLDVDGPTEPTALAKAFRDYLRAAKRWLTRAQLVRRAAVALPAVLPGWVVVWDRGTAAAPWRGHVGIVAFSSAAAFVAVEGNSGPRFDEVARMPHTVHEPRLLGAGVLSGPMP